MTSSPIISARVAHQKELQRAHRFSERGRLKEAEEIYRRYAAKYPDDSQVLFNLGVLVQRRADSPADRVEALDFYQRAVCAPGEAYVKANAANNCGLIMGKINRPDKAAIFFHMALQINPANNAARLNYADCLRHDGHYEEADKEFAEIMRQDPTSDPAKFSAGMIALLLGDLKRGFELYEHRFGVASFPTRPFKTKKPKWEFRQNLQNQRNGSGSGHSENCVHSVENLPSLEGKTILLCEEQGFGDTMMFWRYCRELKKQWPTCKVWFRGNALYRNIAKSVDGLDRFFAVEDSIPEKTYDYYCHLLSLPNRFGTTIDTIVNDGPWIDIPKFDCDFDLSTINSQPWLTRRIGLCWAGSPRHGKDAWRSLAPESFAPLIDARPDIAWYSLQIGPRAHEFSSLQSSISNLQSSITDLSPHITDWTETAQAIQQLDLVISVDTALVHLCGALDKPCWMLTPFSPDWRWMLSGDRTPWYPSVKLYRQPKPDDWSPVLEKIKDELNKENREA